MRILILGGTQFLGRHLVEAARARGHDLTLFHRGNRDPYPELENVIGDRQTDLERLEGDWDAVIDTSGYLPRVVRQSAEFLKDRVAHYCFISTVSVYASFDPPPTEDAPVGRLEVETEEITGESYGPLKALCEDGVNAIYGSRALVIRPGLIVGRFDTSDRFTYWPHRLARGGQVVVPGTPEYATCFIDAVDLARFTIHALEQDLSGTFNADGLTMPLGGLLEAIRDQTGSDAWLTWLPDEFLVSKGVKPWMGPDSLPLWIPNFTLATPVDKALAAGLTHRPLSDTIAETLEYAANRGDSHEWRSGITPEREAELLVDWRAL